MLCAHLLEWSQRIVKFCIHENASCLSDWKVLRANLLVGKASLTRQSVSLDLIMWSFCDQVSCLVNGTSGRMLSSRLCRRSLAFWEV